METILKLGISCVLVAGIGVILFNRTRKKQVSLANDILPYINEHKTENAKVCAIVKLSSMPENIQTEYFKTLGIKQVIQGYTAEGSLILSFMDENEQGIENLGTIFWGNILSEDIQKAMGSHKHFKINI